MNNKTITETREALEKILGYEAGHIKQNCLCGLCEQRDQIMQLLDKEKQDLLESLIERFGERYDEELERESKNQELDGASAFAEAIAITKTLATEKLAEMSKIQEGKGEK